MKKLGVLSVLWCVGLASIGLGCPSSNEYVRVPVEEARALNTHVSAFSSTTLDLLEVTSHQVEGIGTLPDGIRSSDFELQLVKNALIACFNENISLSEVTNEIPRGVQATIGTDPLRPLTQRPNMDTVLACNPSEMISLESYLEYAPDRISDFISERVLTVDSLRVNLKHVLQERINRLEELVQDGRAETAQLRETSRQRYESTMSSDEVSSEERRQTEADYEVVMAELDEIDGLLDSINAQLTELRRYRRQLVEDVTVHLTAMGTSGS